MREFFGGYACAEKSHADAQEILGAQFNARHCAIVLGDEMKRHAEKQGVENGRAAVRVGDKQCGGADHDGR